MELRHLRYFLAVAETGNVTRAAQESFVAQSALSSQLARLEGELGVALFTRSRRGMQLTVAGETLRPMATALLADADRIADAMTALRGGLAGRFRVGVIQGAPAHLDAVNLAAGFHRAYPGVDLHVRTGASDDLARDVVDGALDLAVVALRGPDLPAALTVVPLVDDPLVAVIGRDRTSWPGGPVSIGELVTMGSFIHYRRGSGLRRSVEGVFERAGVDGAGSFELDQIDDMVRLAALGVGVTIVPASAVDGSPTSDDTATVVPLADELALHTISAVTLGPPSRAARALLTMIET